MIEATLGTKCVIQQLSVVLWKFREMFRMRGIIGEEDGVVSQSFIGDDLSIPLPCGRTASPWSIVHCQWDFLSIVYMVVASESELGFISIILLMCPSGKLNFFRLFVLVI